MIQTMKEKMRECRDVEELIYTHVQYTSSIQYQVLLNEKVIRIQTVLTKLSIIYNTIMDILNMAISFSQKYLQLKQESISTKHDRKSHKRTSSQSDDERSTDFPIESISESEFIEYVKHVDDRFLRAVPFIRSGLKASARAAEYPTLGMLAASLEVGVR